MVDVPREDIELKEQMLTTLKKLPITNKTILKDSKILPIVQKWSLQLLAPAPIESTDTGKDTDTQSEPTTPMTGTAPTPLPHKKRHHLLHRVQSEHDVSSSDSEMSDSAKLKLSESDDTNQGDSTASTNTGEDTDASAAVKEGLENVKSLAGELVSSWDSLKESFKIPKLKVEERKKREKELGMIYHSSYMKTQTNDVQFSFVNALSGTNRCHFPFVICIFV